MMFCKAHRPATTLIELLIYVAILGVIAAVVLPILFMSTEDRLLQQTVSVVEQNGTQLLQTISYQVRHAELILSPVAGSTGAVLALQTGSGGSNPTIIGMNSGSLILIRRTARETLSSAQVAVQNFVVRNTSVDSQHQSIQVQFTISRTVRLQAPRFYEKSFEALITLFPDDEKVGNACHCAQPGCDGAGNYVWQVCSASTCLTSQTPMTCP